MQKPSRRALASSVGEPLRGASPMPEGDIYFMVGDARAGDEAELCAGRLACPFCGGNFGPWGFARGRVLRLHAGVVRSLRPRRGRCRECARTMFVPDVCLLRRRDGVAVIGAAIEAKVGGLGHRAIAVELGVPKDTVRGWLRRFEAGAERIRAHFTA